MASYSAASNGAASNGASSNGAASNGDVRREQPKGEEGDRQVPGEMRIVLYRMVSSVTGADFSAEAPLSAADNNRAYEELAKKAGDNNFLRVMYPKNVDANMEHHKFIINALKAHKEEQHLRGLMRKIKTYVYGDIVGRYIQEQPVVCIKGILSMTKVGVEWIKQSTTVKDELKGLWCKALVDAVCDALYAFEKDTKKSLKCFVNIWKVDHTFVGGTTNLQPLPLTKPLEHNVAAEGADLLLEMVEKLVNRKITYPLVSQNIRLHRRASARIIDKLIQAGTLANPILESGEVVQALHSCHKRYAESIDGYKYEKFVIEFRDLLMFKILNQMEHKYDSLAAIFVAVCALIRINPQYRVSVEALCGVVEATLLALQEVESYLISNFGIDTWGNFEEVMDSRLREQR